MAKNLDNAVKLCSEETIRAGTRAADAGKTEKRALDAGLLRWVDDAPAALKAMAAREGGTARIGQWFDPHATIWVIAQNDRPACHLIVGGSYWTPRVRPALYAKMQDDNFWRMQGPEQPFAEKLVRAEFRAVTPPAAKVQPAISVVAPITPSEGATQLTIGIYLVSKEK